MSYALSKVGKPEMVLKNEQLTAIQHVYNGKDVFVWLPTGYPSLSVNATRNIGTKRPKRLACFASTVNKLVACFASSSESQKRQRYFKAIFSAVVRTSPMLCSGGSRILKRGFQCARD